MEIEFHISIAKITCEPSLRTTYLKHSAIGKRARPAVILLPRKHGTEEGN